MNYFEKNLRNIISRYKIKNNWTNWNIKVCKRYKKVWFADIETILENNVNTSLFILCYVSDNDEYIYY